MIYMNNAQYNEKIIYQRKWVIDRQFKHEYSLLLLDIDCELGQ